MHLLRKKKKSKTGELSSLKKNHSITSSDDVKNISTEAPDAPPVKKLLRMFAALVANPLLAKHQNACAGLRELDVEVLAVAGI